MLLQIRKIPNKKKISNFIEIQYKPFTYLDVVNETGVNVQTVRNNLRNLVLNGSIKCIRRDKGINIYARKQIKNKAGPSFNTDLVKELVNIIINNRCKTYRQIAKLASFNRIKVLNYLEAMASVDIIFFDDIYRINNLSMINRVGSRSEKNILRKIRTEINLTKEFKLCFWITIIKYQQSRNIRFNRF